ncbi:hypothetical protein ABZP36_010588 [Zizania latifolia]
MGDSLAIIQYTGYAAQNKVSWKQRGQWSAISQRHELFRNVQRFVSNAYMDSEKQNAPDMSKMKSHAVAVESYRGGQDGHVRLFLKA